MLNRRTRVENRPATRGIITALGPAFVAAIAYVDPGNVAANVSAGASFGYLLVWVLVIANVMAMVIQYLSAKLGIVTGKSLPEVVGESLPRRARIAYWVQAELMAVATDVAEVIGGALALWLLFGVPLPLGGVIVAVISMAVLSVQNRRGQRIFETVILSMLGIITAGFLAGLVVAPPEPAGVLGGVVPRLQGSQSLVLAASMLGATVMPHAIYLHSALSRDRHGGAHGVRHTQYLLRATRVDVVIALIVAGSVNMGMLLLAARNLYGVDGTDTIEGAHAAIAEALGPAVGIVFAIGLLASGLASTAVGSYAGDVVTAGLLHRRIPLFARRVFTMIPAVVLLAVGVEPTAALVGSQVVLSFGIAFALIPLVWFTGRRRLLGQFTNGPLLSGFGWASSGIVVALNVVLLGLMAIGAA
ncbi:divalent metal cation transporter [Kocuria sp. WRN011]|uniref:Nramp family divalent metal transporter n=1 Tax=Kocuria carniphila TaxID=262208 RepID=A0ABV3V0Y4_9MICC|nr:MULTISPECIES: Nramp family divalent metal transporter [Kocuria]MCT1803227.1 Nramp family divalent metal transporter [Kocuria carniphila]PBB09454.1 divalent metal cation transporter [Kocuria sp. WRN011]PZP37049.1 MAG: divalent metal cation transporter MntH [Kocuria rhizophila]